MIEGYVVVVIVALQSIGHIVIATLKERRYQQTIDRLTDKLMARDYGEYKRLERNVEREEKPVRKPLSWHDDPSVEIEQ